MIGLLGLLIALATFYAKDADALSDKSLKFTQTLIVIVVGATVWLGIAYIARWISTLF